MWRCRNYRTVFILAPGYLANVADNVAMWRLFEECNIGLLLCLSEEHRRICVKLN